MNAGLWFAATLDGHFAASQLSRLVVHFNPHGCSLSRFQQPRFEERAATVNHDAASENGFGNDPAAVLKLQTAGIDAATD
jgi:hypothetical protein